MYRTTQLGPIEGDATDAIVADRSAVEKNRAFCDHSLAIYRVFFHIFCLKIVWGFGCEGKLNKINSRIREGTWYA
jgi:hypothetical protein